MQVLRIQGQGKIDRALGELTLRRLAIGVSRNRASLEGTIGQNGVNHSSSRLAGSGEYDDDWLGHFMWAFIGCGDRLVLKILCKGVCPNDTFLYVWIDTL